eukprot:scaffold54_cov158-Amphora_coffeaeformis.AAC.2
MTFQQDSRSCRWMLGFTWVLSVATTAQGFLLGDRSSQTLVAPKVAFTFALKRSPSDGESDGIDEAGRMELVRSLQETFYSSPSTSSAVGPEDGDDVRNQDEGSQWLSEKGIMTNLPLWRVGWIEVPGRSNILNVHEGHYTHMFETILRRKDQTPKYFGHLYLPGGTKASRTGERRFALKSWREEVTDKERFESAERSAVLGCLMRITDYRRLQDGRLILHVQALERFIVDEVVQEFPYAVANVQLLPDVEQLGEPSNTKDENFGTLARGNAAKRAIQHYHPYEFAETKLPLPSDDEYMAVDAIAAAAMVKLLPFAECNLDATFDPIFDVTDNNIPSAEENILAEAFSGGAPLLEDELERLGLLHGASIKSITQTDADGLEKLIWLSLEELTRHTGFVLPDGIKCLLPPEMDCLDFAEPSSSGPILAQRNLQQPALSPNYPSLRRQSRLSFAVPAIWEKPDQTIAIRQGQLQIKDTKSRLALVLQELQNINRKYDDSITGTGEFE